MCGIQVELTMKNWIRVTMREMNKLIAEKGMNEQESKNFRFMVFDCQRRGYKGVYFVNCICQCKKVHENLLLIKEFKDNDTMTARYKNDMMPMMVCKDCMFEMQTLRKAGVKPNVIADLLGWDNKGVIG